MRSALDRLLVTTKLHDSLDGLTSSTASGPLEEHHRCSGNSEDRMSDIGPAKRLPATRRNRSGVLLLATLATMCGGLVPSAAAGDTPTYGGGDCWRVGTPFSCRSNWSGTNAFISFKLINHFNAQRPVWYGGADQARNAWSAAPGSQILSWSDAPSQGWDYLEYSSTGDHSNTDRTLAITWTCDIGGWCQNTLAPINARWASIWLNHNTIDGTPPAIFIQAVGHELGHTMLLDHNTDPARSSIMHPVVDGSVLTPQGDDIGNVDLCNCPPPGGVRCVFGSVGSV